ncbi:hypothetical protein D9615_009913 [Tricholomella constricta]|uniref:Uncharacterized protein n=1 Tax=Tricholomella constricta TaxID=117010 RepID=A0A8H5LYF1_9AGAR|nr:hypothetical protein D9615_009913 [Tricholomella constricta]
MDGGKTDLHVRWHEKLRQSYDGKGPQDLSAERWATSRRYGPAIIPTCLVIETRRIIITERSLVSVYASSYTKSPKSELHHLLSLLPPSVCRRNDLFYVPIISDILPAHITFEQLRRHAQDGRGITALPLPSIAIQSTHHPLLTALSPISRIWPPDYFVHTITAIPSVALIAPYTSTIAPSVARLADPLITYAHLGLPKAFVHLLGPLTSDSTPIAGDHAFFVRSRGLLNAVLPHRLVPSPAPASCPPPATQTQKRKRTNQTRNRSQCLPNRRYGSFEKPHAQTRRRITCRPMCASAAFNARRKRLRRLSVLLEVHPHQISHHNPRTSKRLRHYHQDRNRGRHFRGPRRHTESESFSNAEDGDEDGKWAVESIGKQTDSQLLENLARRFNLTYDVFGIRLFTEADGALSSGILNPQ